MTNGIQETTKIRTWYGCYDGGWGNNITSLSYAHPAKMAKNLSERIYAHMLEQGWLKPGDTVLDPFGGIGGTCLGALTSGLNWVGCELEARFTDLGQGCNCTGISKADWIRFYGRWEKVAHKDGRHWCPDCLAQAQQVTESWQLSFFEPEPSAAYTRNSGLIPETFPHRYRGNLELFRKYAKPGTWAVLLNGDSRYLRRVIAQAQVDGILSSPPYSGSRIAQDNGNDNLANFGRNTSKGRYGSTAGQLGGMSEGNLADAVLSSPPYANGCAHTGGDDPNPQHIQGGKNGVYGANYSKSPDNLGNLSEGNLDGILSSPPFSPDQPAASQSKAKKDYHAFTRGDGTERDHIMRSQGNLDGLPMSGFDAALSSPPFAGNTGGRGEASRNGIDAALFDRHSGGMKRGTGESPDNLDHLPMRGLAEALLSSPPFENAEPYQDKNFRLNDGRKALPQGQQGYGSTPGQLGTMTGGFSKALELAGLSEAEQDKALRDAQEEREAWRQSSTFWAAARLIVSECFEALKPGSYSAWVLKAFIRNGERVEFPDQWRQLCEVCGFEFVEEIRAMMVTEKGVQVGLDGEDNRLTKESKSFFRRLFENKLTEDKQHLRIDWETVLIMRKPL